MTRLVQVSFTALVLMCHLAAAQSSAQPTGPNASAPTGLALEVTFSKDKPPAFSPVGGPCCKPVGAWYSLFGLSETGATSPGLLPVKAVDVRSRIEGELVRVTVSVFRGARFLEKKEHVATYGLRENEGVRAVALTGFGVEPFDIKVIRVHPNLTYTPAVTTNAQSIAVVGVELKNTPLPAYKLTLHNSSDKNVMAMGINVMANDRLRRSALPQGRDGRPLFRARETAYINVGGAYEAQTTFQGYRPEAPPDQEIVITSVVFDDGSFEGDVKMAATFTAFTAGRKIQVANLIALIDSTPNSPDGSVASALEYLKTRATLLSTDADPRTIDTLRKSFPNLPGDELKVSVDVALQGLKSDFLECIKEFEKDNAQSSERQFRQWLSVVKLRYEKWLSRLTDQKSNV